MAKEISSLAFFVLILIINGFILLFVDYCIDKKFIIIIFENWIRSNSIK